VKTAIYRLLRFGPNLYSFLAGIYVATTINLFTLNVYPCGVSLAMMLPYAAGFLFLAAGVLSFSLATELEQIGRDALSSPPELLKRADGKKDLWMILIDSKLKKLALCFLLSLFLPATGILLLTNYGLNLLQAIIP